jgi:hypothetical protein
MTHRACYAGPKLAAVPAPPKPEAPPRPPTVVSSFSDTTIHTLMPAGLVTQNTVDSYGGSCKTLKQNNHEFVKFLSGWHLAAADDPIPSPPPTVFGRKRSRRHLLVEFKKDYKEYLQPPSPPPASPPPPPPPPPARRFVAGCKDVKAGPLVLHEHTIMLNSMSGLVLKLWYRFPFDQSELSISKIPRTDSPQVPPSRDP